MQCDIVIPTYQSAQVLPATIKALTSQHIPPSWQICLIVSDDGSTDSTLSIARQLCGQSPFPHLILTNAHTGSAGARNRAINQSNADIILLLGADIILRPGALSAHLLFHTEHPAPHLAALGYIKWDPRTKPTPFMEWMMHGGSQNNFDALLGKRTVDPRHFFYGSHLSIKRTILGNNPFSSQFKYYGWEDIELGRRLFDQHNLTLHLLHGATGLHHHHYSAQQIHQRQRVAGQGLITYQQKYPKIKLLHDRGKGHYIKYRLFIISGLFYLLTLIIQRTSPKYSTPRLFSLYTAISLWQGIYSYPRKN